MLILIASKIVKLYSINLLLYYIIRIYILILYAYLLNVQSLLSF